MTARAEAATGAQPTPRLARASWPAIFYAVGAIVMFVVMAICIRALASPTARGRHRLLSHVLWPHLDAVSVRHRRGTSYARGLLATRRLGLFTLRAILTYTAVISYFLRLTKIPAAGGSDRLNSTLPIFMTAMAAAMLGERVGIQRWLAVALGSPADWSSCAPASPRSRAGRHWRRSRRRRSTPRRRSTLNFFRATDRRDIVFYIPNLLVSALVAGPLNSPTSRRRCGRTSPTSLPSVPPARSRTCSNRTH